MKQIRTGMVLLLCAALALAALACKKQDAPSNNGDAAVLTVGDVPVYALTYRYQLNARYDSIKKNNLDDWDTYLSSALNPSVYYPYPYRDTRTEEGIQALCEDVLNELALEAASIYAGKQAGYTLSIRDQSMIENAKQSASEALEEIAESYDSIDAFYRETGFTEESFRQMYARSKEASAYFQQIYEAYQNTHEIDDASLEAGYARIVKETFEDRYRDGMYSQYLYYYITGARTYPSLYIPDDAIFVRLFVNTDPTEEEAQAFETQAKTDFNTLYIGKDNEYIAQGTAGDVAVAPRDSLIEGLYDAAKDVAIGDVGTLRIEKDGKVTLYLFLRVEGETGRVPIDRYPGVREMITRQLTGTFCMDTLREMIDDPAVTVRNEELLRSIRPES